MGIPHAVECGDGDPYAEESAYLTLKVRSISAECHDLDGEPNGTKQISAKGGKELLPELYCRWAHIQPLARCLSGQATTAENKHLKPGCPVTAHRVDAEYLQVGGPPSAFDVELLLFFSALRKIMNGVRLTVGQIRSLGIAHSVMVMSETRSLKMPR